MLAIDIHDEIAQRKELPWWQRLGEEVRHVFRALHERDRYFESLHTLAHEKMSAIDVLGASVVFRVVGKVNGGHVVHRERRRRVGAKPQFREQSAKIYGLLGGLGGSDNLGLARGQSNRGLLLRGPGDGRLPVNEDVPGS
eukprot:6208331-Pleurochrysis_carterae.AAC.1